MFDETLKALRALERGTRIPIDILLDEDRYLDRMCPEPRCRGHFKVIVEDWKEKVRDETAFCAFCRHAARATDWNTPAQTKYIAEVGTAHVAAILDRSLAEDARRFNRNRPSGRGAGLFSISMSLSYRPGVRRVPLPPGATEELRQRFMCDACGCRYASLGASFFCHACGGNSAVTAARDTVRLVREAARSAEHLEEVLRESLDADIARDLMRAILEDQFPRLVGAFERFAEATFSALGSSTVAARGAFQRLDEGSALWKQATGRGFEDRVPAAVLAELRVFLHRRHVLVHRQGVVDEIYRQRSGDTGYEVGQRIVVRPQDVLRFAEVVEGLMDGLTK